LRQDIAGLHSWITVPVGAAMTVITTPESLPDGSSLRDFAIAQGFDASAMKAIFGPGENVLAAPVNALSDFSGSSHPEDLTSLSVVDNRCPVADLFQSGSAAAVAADGAEGAQADGGLEGLSQSDQALQITGLGDFVVATENVSHNLPTEAASALKSDSRPGISRGDLQVLGAGASARLANNPEGAQVGRETGGQALDRPLDSVPGSARVLITARQVALEGAETYTAAMARPSTALVSGLPGTAVIPASLHALRAGWYSGASEGASLLAVNPESSAEGLALDGPVALTGWAVKAAGETGSGASGNTAGGNADVVALDRLAAEVAEERLGFLIAQRMLSGIQRGEWQIRMLLRPESLGEVEIQMRMQAGALVAQLSAAQESTKEILNQGLERLRDYFQRSGMEVASLGVSAHSKGGGDGKPTGKSAGISVKPAETGNEEEVSSSSNGPVAGQSGSQWDMFV
jgi:hypothetical protein